MNNNKTDWLTEFLFAHTRKTKPDGRPLYAYKCDDKKYIELKEQLIGQLHYLDNKGASVTKFPYFFVFMPQKRFAENTMEALGHGIRFSNHLE